MHQSSLQQRTEMLADAQAAITMAVECATMLNDDKEHPPLTANLGQCIQKRTSPAPDSLSLYYDTGLLSYAPCLTPTSLLMLRLTAAPAQQAFRSCLSSPSAAATGAHQDWDTLWTAYENTWALSAQGRVPGPVACLHPDWPIKGTGVCLRPGSHPSDEALCKQVNQPIKLHQPVCPIGLMQG